MTRRLILVVIISNVQVIHVPPFPMTQEDGRPFGVLELLAVLWAYLRLSSAFLIARQR